MYVLIQFVVRFSKNTMFTLVRSCSKPKIIRTFKGACRLKPCFGSLYHGQFVDTNTANLLVSIVTFYIIYNNYMLCLNYSMHLKPFTITNYPCTITDIKYFLSKQRTIVTVVAPFKLRHYDRLTSDNWTLLRQYAIILIESFIIKLILPVDLRRISTNEMVIYFHTLRLF